jgi:DNA (cytosine-5)-methyltransferase 1
MAFVQNQREEVREQEVSGALSAEPGSHQTTYIAFDPAQITSKANRSNPLPGDPVHTLHKGEAPMLVRMREGKAGGGKGPLVSEDKSLTLATANDQVLAFEPGSIARNAGPSGESHQVPTLRSSMGDNQPAIRQGMQVRRLTPVECERLQGFPDGYTNIPWRGKPESPDGPRYKALGNSWAVPCAAWIGKQIHNLDK